MYRFIILYHCHLDWLRAKGFPTDFEHRPPKELNDSLVQFYQESETRTGCKRKASSLRIIRTGIDHHLQGEPYCWPHSLTRSANFMSSNAVLHQLENMQKEEALLPSEARKNMVAVKQEDIRKLWSSGVIGINRPKPLQRLVFLVIGVNFGITSRDFLHDLAADVFEFGTDETTGLEYVQCKAIRPEESHKQLSKRTKCSSKKVFSLPGCVQCPVSALKLYLKKRNPECTAFFQVPYRDIVVGCPDSVLWYRAEATGVNTLSRMMKDMSEEAGLSMNYTNNALRTTSPVALFEGIADCSVRNLPIKSCGLQLYDQSVSCQNRASGIEQTAAPIQMSVNPSLSVKWHVPILPRPLSREPAPEPCNGERTFESTGTANNSTELCLPKVLCKTQTKPASCGDEQVVSTAPRPVLCIPQQWQIKDIIAALNSGEALLLAKQPAAKKQDHLHANDISSAVPAPSRSSRKQVRTLWDPSRALAMPTSPLVFLSSLERLLKKLDLYLGCGKACSLCIYYCCTFMNIFIMWIRSLESLWVHDLVFLVPFLGPVSPPASRGHSQSCWLPRARNLWHPGYWFYSMVPSFRLEDLVSDHPLLFQCVMTTVNENPLS